VHTASIIRAMSALMMEAVRTFETSVNIFLTTQQYIPEDSKLHTRRHENLKSLKVPLHYVKVGVWCIVNTKEIIGPILLCGNNSDRYVRPILTILRKAHRRGTIGHTCGFSRIQQLPTPQTIHSWPWNSCSVTE
jgi:hypothetical protein